jgi:hypothetical protein
MEIISRSSAGRQLAVTTVQRPDRQRQPYRPLSVQEAGAVVPT